MSLKDIIEQGSSFKIDAENDFNNDPSWINDSNLDKYQQWEHCTSMYLKDKYPNANLETLKKYRKGHTKEQAEEALKILRKLDVTAEYGYIMIDPELTYEQLKLFAMNILETM